MQNIGNKRWYRGGLQNTMMSRPDSMIKLIYG